MEEMKQTGVQWIGEIPSTWNTKRIKYMATLKGRIGWQGLTSEEYQDGGAYLITGVDFANGGIDWDNCVHVPMKRWEEATDIQIEEGDLLITKDGTIGKVAIVTNMPGETSLNSGVLRIIPIEGYSRRFLYWVLKSDEFWNWFNYKNAGNSTIVHLYQGDFVEFLYAFPDFAEQEAIADYLDTRCNKLDKIIAAIHGTKAVQTLSRLNRICPPYDKTTFVLDFKNSYDDIKAAFEPYYKDTILFETISPSDIRDLDREIDAYDFLDADDIDEFNTYLYKDNRTARDKQRMWSLLDGALKKITKRPELQQMEIKITIRRFLKGYCFLIQATAYENLEFHKRYNFLSYLIKELNPGGGGNNFDIADKITVSDFRQKQMEKHQGEEIEATPEVKIKKPKPASLEEEQKKLLSQIIDEVNALYDKDYEPDFTTKAAMQIRDLLLKNAALKERLEKSAKNNTLNEFKFTYDDCVQDALVEGYDQNADFYTLLLSNEEIRAKFANVFMTEIYRILREGTQTD